MTFCAGIPSTSLLMPPRLPLQPPSLRIIVAAGFCRQLFYCTILPGNVNREESRCLVFASFRRYNEGHSDLDGQLHGKAGIVWERFLLLRVSM